MNAPLTGRAKLVESATMTAACAACTPGEQRVAAAESQRFLRQISTLSAAAKVDHARYGA